MGTDAEGERIKDQMRTMVPILIDPTVAVDDKMRIIYLYVVQRGGINEESLSKLILHAQIPLAQASIIRNLAHLGIPVIQDASGAVSGKCFAVWWASSGVYVCFGFLCPVDASCCMVDPLCLTHNVKGEEARRSFIPVLAKYTLPNPVF